MVTCPSCSKRNPSDALTCSKCGADLLPPKSMASKIPALAIWLVLAGAGLWIGFSTQVAFFQYSCLGTGALLAAWSLFGFFRKAKRFERFELRAKRLESSDREQALADLDTAIWAAPESKISELAHTRAKLFKDQPEQLVTGLILAARLVPQGKRKDLIAKESKEIKIAAAKMLKDAPIVAKEARDSARNRLYTSYLNDICVEVLFPSKATTNWLEVAQAAGIGARQGNMMGSAIAERRALVEESLAQRVGFCPQCQDMVELNEKSRCPKHKKGPQGEVLFILPEEWEQTRKRLKFRYLN